MRVALTQMDIAWEDAEKNRETCRVLAGEAAENGADIILFPEMTLSGFSMNVKKIADRENESVRFFSKLADGCGLAVGFGYVTEREGRGQNHFCVVDSVGNVLEDYVKIHPFTGGGEADFYDGGGRICHFSLNGFVCGMFICYDLRFPDCFQELPMDTDAVFLIANWPESRIEQWHALLRARAIELQCYVAGVNRVGTGNGIRYTESSVVYDAAGDRVPLRAGNHDILYAGLDREKRIAYAESFPTRCDRRILRE